MPTTATVHPAPKNSLCYGFPTRTAKGIAAWNATSAGMTVSSISSTVAPSDAPGAAPLNAHV